MRFVVLPVGSQAEQTAGTASLVTDNWNDYWEFQTLYHLSVCDQNGMMHNVGGVKIGQFHWAKNQYRPAIPEIFEALGNEFFSVGQDVSYYEVLRDKLSWNDRMAVLSGLRDMAHDEARFARAKDEEVTRVSLTRNLTSSTIETQFRRVLNGGASLSEFHFTFRSRSGHDEKPVDFDFSVIPGSNPPSNVHVLIGRNGVGKTRFLNSLRDGLIKNQAAGSVTDEKGKALFANIVSVSFSAFDRFQPQSDTDSLNSVQYSYIGLREFSKPLKNTRTKTSEELAIEFGKSAIECFQGARLSRWRRVLEVLQADPIFNDASIADLADMAEDFGDSNWQTIEIETQAVNVYNNLSSGHKIVLLTITRLVELVEEKSIVLLDEPEAHLHPPLLSAFIRSLSDLLVNRNGVAVIATHSPVVLQEVPRDCVWKLRRAGRRWIPARPEIETFGENVGVLTTEVFGLEVTQSGFHKILQSKVDQGMSMSDIIEEFEGKLGGEGRSIVRGMIRRRDTAAS